jgi:hypothetical protein
MKGETDRAIFDRSRLVRKMLLDHAVENRYDLRKTLVVSHGVTLAFSLIDGKYNENYPKDKQRRHLQYFKNT